MSFDYFSPSTFKFDRAIRDNNLNSENLAAPADPTSGSHTWDNARWLIGHLGYSHSWDNELVDEGIVLDEFLL